jgi:phage portal protein BeeE
MRVLSGTVTVGRGTQGVRSPNAGIATVQRDRRGFAPFFSVGDMSVYRVIGQRIFTPDELFRIYQITPDIRAAVDRTTLRLANTPWIIQPSVKKSDPDYEIALELCRASTEWLNRPNAESDWPEFAQKWSHDLLLYDAYATERVYDGKGRLQEIVEWRSGDITPLQDEHGREYAYRQDAAIHGPVIFTPDELDYGNLFANTQFPNGQPLIETLVEEFITMRAQAQHLRRLVDADQIPPGILALIGVGDVALKRFKAEMEGQQGRDDLFRMVSTEDPNGKVEWLQLHRSLKDLDWLPNIREVRKTIWRVFHVTPVTMGETDAVPRASAEVQVEIADQGLIGPMFQQLTRLVNERWLPLWLGNPDLAKLVCFSFDTTPALSQTDQKIRADRLAVLVNANILTVNESREELGYDAVEAGDEVQATSDTATADGTAEADAADSVAEGGARPGAHVQRHRPASIYRRTRGGQVVRGELPSDWQPSGRFKDVRTLDLSRLGGLVREYDDVVTPLYERCARAVLRAATTAVSDGVLTATEATAIVSAVARETVRLVDDWSSSTTDLYARAAGLGSDAAVAWGASEIAWQNIATTYQASAISYLTTSGGKSAGLVTAIRQELTDLILATMSRTSGLVRRSEQARQLEQRGERRDPHRRAEDKLPADLGAFLEAVRRVFERHQHRISNWSGRLIELAHTVTGQSLRTPSAQEPTPDSDPNTPAATPDPWMVEWVEVSDTATCSTCLSLGAKGFMLVESLPTTPGGATDCGARCRCVLVYWKQSEVQSGKAKRLGPIRSVARHVAIPRRLLAR